MLRGVFLDRFDDLLAAWRDHARLRAAEGVTVRDLASSRHRLDQLRQETNRIRRSFAPEPKELESVLLTTFCSTFDETIFLFQSDADWSGDRPRFRCVCGAIVGAAAHLS